MRRQGPILPPGLRCGCSAGAVQHPGMCGLSWAAAAERRCLAGNGGLKIENNNNPKKKKKQRGGMSLATDSRECRLPAVFGRPRSYPCPCSYPYPRPCRRGRGRAAPGTAAGRGRPGRGRAELPRGRAELSTTGGGCSKRAPAFTPVPCCVWSVSPASYKLPAFFFLLLFFSTPPYSLAVGVLHGPTPLYFPDFPAYFFYFYFFFPCALSESSAPPRSALRQARSSAKPPGAASPGTAGAGPVLAAPAVLRSPPRDVLRARRQDRAPTFRRTSETRGCRFCRANSPGSRVLARGAGVLGSPWCLCSRGEGLGVRRCAEHKGQAAAHIRGVWGETARGH